MPPRSEAATRSPVPLADGTPHPPNSVESRPSRPVPFLLDLSRMRSFPAFAAVAVLVVGCGGRAIQVSPDGGDGGAGSSSGSGSSSGGSSGSGSSSGASSSGSSSGGTPRVPIYHRPSDAQCLAPAAPGTCGGSGNLSTFQCTSDPQCADAGPTGRCSSDAPAPFAGCHCTYDACASDGDCPSGQLCACHGSAFLYGEGNECMPGDCRVDSDCGPGGYCSPSQSTGGCGGLAGYYCHTAGDQCVDDSDCPMPDAQPAVPACMYSSAAGYWQCAAAPLCV